MDLLHPRCAGLDVHAKTVVASIRVVEEEGVRRETRTFGTTTTELYKLFDWLQITWDVAIVVMESTGVYWKPVWHVMEEGFEVVLANAKHVKNVPGRKTDVKDAEWLAELLAHGLIRASFVPMQPIQELRDLTRLRKQVVRDRTSYVQRIQKVLEDANIKVTNVISDIMGRSGRAMLDAITAGRTDPVELAKLAHPRLEASAGELAEALRGRVTRHHRALLGFLLEQYDASDRAIAKLEGLVEVALKPFQDKVELLMTIPGVGPDAAAAIAAEIGTDMERFPTAGHLVSWAGLCPRSDESAGKRRSTKIRKGAPWLKGMLIQAAWSATRTKRGYLPSFFRRIKSRRGPGKAIIAVAASMLASIHHMLLKHEPYRDLGADHLEKRSRAQLAGGLVRRLKHLGYTVELKEAA